MRQFLRRVRRIRAREHPSGGYDGEEQYGIVDVIEAVRAYAVALLQAYGSEAGDELPDDSFGLTGRDGYLVWLGSIDVEWFVPVMLVVVERPREYVFGRDGEVLGGKEWHVWQRSRVW